MRETIRRNWRKLKEAEPGRRFQEFHAYRKEKRKGKSAAWHVVPIGLGVVLLVGGAAIGWLPGPGGFIAIIGLALLATEIPWLARWLDRAELWLRAAWRWGWKRRSVPVRAAVALLAVLLAAGAAYAANAVLFD